MGTNVSGFAYWESNYPFIDLRRQSDAIQRELGSWNIAESSGAVMDDRGNITGLATGSVNKGLIYESSCLYTGDYVVLWNEENSPSIRLGYDGPGSLDMVEDDAANGRRVYTLSLPGDLTKAEYMRSLLMVRIDAPVSGPTDWHVILPGLEEAHNDGKLFNPDYVSDMKNYDVLRFMDWAQVNHSQVTDIQDLSTMDQDTWSGETGVPYPVQMRLAKATGAGIAWINIPHLATAETIHEIARQVYAEWEPGLKVYIEYSNEVWNTIFTQSGYADQQGKHLFPSIADAGGSAQSTFIAQKSVEMKEIFTSVFGNDAAAVRLVVAGHIEANGYQGSDPAKCFHNCRIANPFNDIADQIDVYAVAPYFSAGLQGPQESDVESWADSKLYSHLSDAGTNSDIQHISRQLRINMDTLTKFTGRQDIVFATYEFGQHLTAQHDPKGELAERYSLLQQSTAMGNLYHDLIQAMINAGITVAANYDSHSRHSGGMYWGSRQGIAGNITPRHLAIEAAYQN